MWPPTDWEPVLYACNNRIPIVFVSPEAARRCRIAGLLTEELTEVPEEQASPTGDEQLSSGGYTAQQLDDFEAELNHTYAQQMEEAERLTALQERLRLWEADLNERDGYIESEHDEDESVEPEADERSDDQDHVDVWEVEREPSPEPDNKICTLCVEKEANKALRDSEGTSDDPYHINHRTFDNSPASIVYLSWHDQYGALHEAHNIAKKAFWYAYRKHWPVHCLRKFGESWQQVRFGRTELDQLGMGTEQTPGYTCQMCNKSRAQVLAMCYGITNLRNTLYHPAATLTAKGLTGWLKLVESFATDLEQEDCLNEIRQVTSDVMQKAREIYADIEACVGTSYCTGPRTEPGTECQSRDEADELVELKPVDTSLPFHTQYLLNEAAGKLKPDFRPSKDYSPAIVEAAKRWQAAGRKPGEDEEYKARVELARSWVRDNTDDNIVRRQRIYEYGYDPEVEEPPVISSYTDRLSPDEIALRTYLVYTNWYNYS